MRNQRPQTTYRTQSSILNFQRKAESMTRPNYNAIKYALLGSGERQVTESELWDRYFTIAS